jgi:LmbE family N-acetylglucosaminyl deacetylase
MTMQGRAIAVVLLLGASGAVRGQEAPPADDRYVFAAEAGHEAAVPFEPAPGGASFSWPEVPAGWDTALLGVRVEGNAPAVRVELRAEGAAVVNDLDAQARGLRWLNLTGLRAQLKPGARVDVSLQGAVLSRAPGVLRTFANRLDLSRRMLIVAPHPDDAEIAAFGLYASARDVTIVTVTSGNAGDANYADDYPDPAEQYRFKGFLRAVDSVTVPWQGGVPPERCYNLGYFDARLRTMHGKPRETLAELYGPNDDVAAYRRANVSKLLPNGPRKNSWANLVDDLEAVLKRVKPEIVVTPHPYLDTHSDHQYVTVALAEALLRWKKPARFLLYTNHSGNNLWPYGPAHNQVPLPPYAAADLPVQAVYSHPLTPDLRRRKLYALETMHDLRLSPAEQMACGDPAAARRPDYPRSPTSDYFRRGPRPEEVFFAFDRDGVRELARAFVAFDAARRAQ